MAAPALDAHELYRFYRVGDEEIFVLRGVGLSVEAGATLAVVGPSGSGKSTLLACLAGLDEPDGGTVRVAGLRISRQPVQVRAWLRREHVGMLFHDEGEMSSSVRGVRARTADAQSVPESSRGRREKQVRTVRDNGTW